MISISNEDLTLLKEKALRAILNNQLLPGSNRPLFFPDLPFILSEQNDIYVLDEHIKTTIYLESNNKPIQVVSKASLNEIADNLKKVIYFQFQTESLQNDSVLLGLDAKVLTSAPNSRTQDLSKMQIKFQKVQNEWKVVDEPTYLSS